jgi:hypothetical protein
MRAKTRAQLRSLMTVRISSAARPGQRRSSGLEHRGGIIEIAAVGFKRVPAAPRSALIISRKASAWAALRSRMTG